MKLRKMQLVFFGASFLALVPAIHSSDYLSEVKSKPILVTTTTENGQPIHYLRTDKPEVTATMVEIPAGAQTGWHMHREPVYAYVLAGQLEVELADGRKLRFKQGDAVAEVQNIAHNGRNIGSDTVRLVVFYTGEVGQPNVTRVHHNGATNGASVQ
jgi:quercetin dioxygenase-like cupin family protein